MLPSIHWISWHRKKENEQVSNVGAMILYWVNFAIPCLHALSMMNYAKRLFLHWKNVGFDHSYCAQHGDNDGVLRKSWLSSSGSPAFPISVVCSMKWVCP